MTLEAWDQLADALEYPADGQSALQERYVEAFDLDAGCTLDIGWHLFGEASERGTFLSILREDLVRAGVDERGNLPDHLPTLLRLIARQDAAEAAELAALVAPAVALVLERLNARSSPFAERVAQVAHALEERSGRQQEEQP